MNQGETHKKLIENPKICIKFEESKKRMKFSFIKQEIKIRKIQIKDK